MYVEEDKREKDLINRIGKISLDTASGTVSTNISKNIGKAFDNAGDFIKNGADAVSDGVSSIIGGIGKKIDSTYSSIKSSVSNAVDIVKVSIGEFKEKAINTVVSIGQGIKNKISGAFDGISGFLKKTKDAMSDLYGKFKENVMALYESIAKKTQQMIDFIVENKNSMLNGLKKVEVAVLDAPYVLEKVIEGSALASIKGSKIENLTFSFSRAKIIENLAGVTPQSTKIANMIKNKMVKVNILSDRMFEDNIPYNLLESVRSPKDINAFYNYEGSIFLRSSRGANVLDDLIHEGTHAIDHLIGYGSAGTKSIWQWEIRAFFMKDSSS